MKKLSRITAALLAIMLLVSLLSGCSGNQGDAQQPDTSEPVAQERAYPYTFTDMAGAEVTLGKAVESVYIVGNVQPLVAIYRYYAGSSDKLLECPAASQSIIANSIFSEIWPDLTKLDSHNDDATVEEILALNPDVVFMTGNATGDAYEALINAGLTVVSFPTAGSSDANDTFAAVEGWLKQMAEVFDDSAAADALISYNDKTLQEIDAKLADVKDENKPEALIVFQLTDNSLKVAGSGHYSEFWLDHSGAKNAAKDIDKLQEIDIEQLMTWDPDIIYLTTFSPAMPEDLYNNTIEGFDFSQLSAVKNHQVYKIPMGSYRWYAPSCECALMLKWMSSINHPDLFKDMDMNKEVSAFITEFYGVTPTDDQIAALLNPSDKSLMNH